MEKKKTRRPMQQLQTVFFSAVILFFLFASSYHQLFRDLLSTFGHDQDSSSSSTATATIYNIRNQYRNYAIIERYPHHSGSSHPSRFPPPPSAAADGVLLPDWEVLLLLSPDHTPPPSSRASCLFQDGAMSPAKYFSGTLPSSRRATFRCTLPSSVRRLRPFYTPRLIPSSAAGAHVSPDATGTELLRWNFLAYESLSTSDDVIVFAKNVNRRQGVNRPTDDLRCVFYPPDGDGAVRTTVTSSSQEVFRCLHPDDAQLLPLLTAARSAGEVRISLEIRDGRGGGKIIPSSLQYRPRATLAAHDKGETQGKSLLCACTMVYNVAKFLREWVMYHSRLGVDRFLLYDNGSDDDLDRVVSELQKEGYNVITLLWPWPKTQEAGFSHCAAASSDSCEWMMFLDVDEFAFSPSWSNSSHPSPDMLRSLLRPSPSPSNTSSTNLPVGQISMGCYEFGPSNRTAHPANGVTQGYTCRRRAEERHKSILLLDAVDPSLLNVVHHFKLKEGYQGRRSVAGRWEAVVVNHYKYQAWPEFKAKFRRRVSAYVADWTQEVNPQSKDRAPGLGFAAVEPEGWAGRFCDVRDTRLRDVGRRWFGVGVDGSTGVYKMAWEAGPMSWR